MGLLLDYKRRLKTAMELIAKGGNCITLTRLGTKASCYRTFISELERLEKEGTSTVCECLLPTTTFTGTDWCTTCRKPIKYNEQTAL